MGVDEDAFRTLQQDAASDPKRAGNRSRRWGLSIESDIHQEFVDAGE